MLRVVFRSGTFLLLFVVWVRVSRHTHTTNNLKRKYHAAAGKAAFESGYKYL
jgi:hypothetical protein